MAEFDFARFGAALDARLAELGYSIGFAARKWPLTDKAMLSRAMNGKTLSAGNVLLVCRMAGLDPFDYLDDGKRRLVTRKTLFRQAVKRAASRETETMTCSEN